MLTGATLRARFLSYLESPVATLLRARALSLFFSFIFLLLFAAGRPHAA